MGKRKNAKADLHKKKPKRVTKAKPYRTPQNPTETANADKDYEVESIEGERFDTYEKQYQVKWEGYTEPTWEPVEHLAGCTAE